MTADGVTDAGEGTGPRVLVTGAGGFVGRALVPVLTAAGFRVVTAGRAAAPGHRGLILPDPATSRDDAFERLMVGVEHVVHLAAIAHTRLEGAEAEAAYRHANDLLPRRLAEAARRQIAGKFVFFSSIRAQCGPSHAGIVDERTGPAPEDHYGRSKLAAEAAIAAAFEDGRFSILRPTLVYGPEAKGNFGFLVRLAGLPVPLPFAALTARRSLVSLDALCRAVLHCLTASATDGGTFLVADAVPIAVHDIVAEIRLGLAMKPGLFTLPPALVGACAVLAGQSSRWRVLSEDLIATPARLAATGWQPEADTGRAIRHAVAKSRRLP